jgi:hypothetical protein
LRIRRRGEMPRTILYFSRNPDSLVERSGQIFILTRPKSTGNIWWSCSLSDPS